MRRGGAPIESSVRHRCLNGANTPCRSRFTPEWWYGSPTTVKELARAVSEPLAERIDPRSHQSVWTGPQPMQTYERVEDNPPW